MALIAYVFIVIGIFQGDLGIKNHIEKRKADADGNVLGRGKESAEKDSEPVSLGGGRILIRKYHNKGAMLNLGQKQPGAVAILSVALTVLTAVAFVCSLGQRGNGLLRTGLALLLGGAFSNTYDRLRRRYVVDYLTFNVRWTPLRRVVFNLSDFCIMIGALLVVIAVPADVL